MKFNKDIRQSLLIIIFIVIVSSLSYLIYLILDSPSAGWIVAVAFVIVTMKETGWKKSITSLSAVIVLCFIAYFIMVIMESKEYKVGLAAYESENFTEAVTFFEQVIAQDKTHYNAYYYLCSSKLKLKQYSEALPYCNQAIHLDYPIKNESFAARARVHENLGATQKAITDYSESLRSFQSWYVLYERCRMYIRNRDYDKAISDCNASLKLNPQWYAPLLPLGNALYQKKDFENARLTYVKYQNKVSDIPDYMRRRIIELSN